jgi:uncharacterized protein
MGTVMARIFQFVIVVYQLCISPLFPAPCRYWPTCSVYAAHAVRDHGAGAGVILALRRIARCHPWGGSGYDPVPEYIGSAHNCADHLESDPLQPESLKRDAVASLEQRL